MSGWTRAMAGALLLAAVNTFGDFVWAQGVPHRAVFGLLHGALLLMALGSYLGMVRHRPLAGAGGGAAVGLAAAALFYGLAPLLGSHAMVVAWMALWLGFAVLDEFALRRTAAVGNALTRGLTAGAQLVL